MLLQTTVSPHLLAGVPSEPYSQKLFCNLWLGLLYDFSESCVVVFPGQHYAERDYLAAISAWPAKYQKRALELINKLGQRRRFVASQLAYIPNPTCQEAVCQAFVGVSAVNLDNIHLVDEKCSSCANIVALAPRTVEALDYFTSDFSRRRRDNLSQVLADGAWTCLDFERQILKPVFTSAKHIKIFDRWIGRSAFDKRRRSVQFNANYKQTLEWVIGIFQKMGGGARGGVFEIYCGIEDHMVNAGQKALLRAEMQTFQANIQASTGIPVQIFLKKESNTTKCPHGRYLVTDQVAVLIDRGFDLLWDDNKMQAARLNPGVDPRPIRDVAVVLCGDCNSIDAKTRMLPDL